MRVRVKERARKKERIIWRVFVAVVVIVWRFVK